MSRAWLWDRKRWAPALVAVACLASAAPARAQLFPFWGEPARPEQRPQALSPGQVRAVLAREGARMVGAPRLRGSEIVAMGRDGAGDRKRFTLDALSGEVLDITVVARHEDRPRPPPGGDLTPPGAPLPPPDHAPPGVDQPANAAAPAPATPVSAAAQPAAPVDRGETATTAPKADSADSALSPIKPLRPSGAPKVEPLPK